MTDTHTQDLSDLLDGELPPDRAAFLLRRVGNDPGLGAQWGRWQVASAAMRRTPQRMLPDAFSDGVMAALAGESRPAAGRAWSVLRWAGGAAVAASVALAALLLMPQPGTGPMAPATDAPPLATAAGARLPVSDLTEDDLRPRFSAPAQTVAASQSGPVLTLTPVAQGMDPEVQLYLLRHQALLRQEGLGGLAPYVEVLAYPEASPAWRASAWRAEGGED